MLQFLVVRYKGRRGVRAVSMPVVGGIRAEGGVHSLGGGLPCVGGAVYLVGTSTFT